MNYLMFKTCLFKCLGVKYMLKRKGKVSLEVLVLWAYSLYGFLLNFSLHLKIFKVKFF